MKNVFSLFLLFVVLVFSACQQASKPDQAAGPTSDTTSQAGAASAAAPQGEAAQEPKTKPKGAIYRADGARPGMASEWVQVDYDKKANKINGIWYWNVQDETPIQAKILSQKFSSDPEGMIAAYDGEISFGSGDKSSFSIIEQTFILQDNGMRIEFDAEGL